MPQLDSLEYPSQIFWLLTSLSICYLLSKKLVSPLWLELNYQRKSKMDAYDLRVRKLRNEIDYLRLNYLKKLDLAKSKIEEEVDLLTNEVAKMRVAKVDQLRKDLDSRIAKVDKEMKYLYKKDLSLIDQYISNLTKIIKNKEDFFTPHTNVEEQ